MIAVVAILALVVAVVLRRQVLAAGEGTPRMQEIALAIQEGASAYLNRQFRTLLLFAVIVFGLLFLLPGDAGVRVGRSVAFLFGAGFSAAIGYLGMWLAVRANLRVAASAQVAGSVDTRRAEGARIAFRTGGVDAEGAQILTALDAVGNTTKAITKGIAIATAVLAATALFGSYADAVATALRDVSNPVGEDGIVAALLSYQIISPITLVGVILGGATVFLFSGLAIDAVTRAAGAIVFEVRRQFRHHPGIMTGEARPEYGRVVDICTRDSLRELATPGLLAAFAPIAVGFGLGVGPLAGFLAGAIGTGVLMAVFLANAGGAWDNAKKIVEDGAYGGKNSAAHAAVVIGDTVGDPFKDTAGPAINPLIKVMNLVSVLIAPAVVAMSVPADANHVLRVAVATVAALIAMGAVVWSRLRAASVDEQGELEHDMGLPV